MELRHCSQCYYRYFFGWSDLSCRTFLSVYVCRGILLFGVAITFVFGILVKVFEILVMSRDDGVSERTVNLIGSYFSFGYLCAGLVIHL